MAALSLEIFSCLANKFFDLTSVPFARTYINGIAIVIEMTFAADQNWVPIMKRCTMYIKGYVTIATMQNTL